MRRLLPVLLLLIFAADARAATYAGAAADPEGDAPAPNVDIVSASWSFDDAAGKVGIVVTLKAKPDAENWGVLNASVRTACEGGMEFATIRVNARESAGGVASAGNYDDGVQPDGSQGPSYMQATNVKSDEGRTTTSEATHERLVGRKPGCVRINISHNGPLDSITIPVQETAGEPTPPPPPPPVTGNPGGPANPQPPTVKPEDVRLGSGRRLTFKKDKASVGLSGVSAGMTVRLSLRLANGTTIAGVLYRAQETRPPLLKLKLTARGRRHLKMHPRGKARLYVRTSYGQAIFQRQYAVSFRKTS